MADAHGTVRVIVKQDGSVEHDRVFINETQQLKQLNLPTMTLLGATIEIQVEFDPPVAHVVNE
jgi:hypothetical protein